MQYVSPHPFNIDFILQNSFRLAAKLNREYREFTYTPYPHTRTGSPTINITPEWYIPFNLLFYLLVKRDNS